jgi:hypothetical protein
MIGSTHSISGDYATSEARRRCMMLIRDIEEFTISVHRIRHHALVIVPPLPLKPAPHPARLLDQDVVRAPS